MRRLIDGPRQIAQIGTLKGLLKKTKEPTKTKLKDVADSKRVLSEGSRMSGMNSYLPSMGNAVDMDRQRLKLGETTKKRKKEDEE